MKKLIVIAGVLLMLGSCYNDKYDKLYPQPATTTCDTSGTVSYANDIQPVIVANCYSPGNGCHDAAGFAVSGFDYQTSITALQNNAASGALVNDINWTPLRGNNNMPKNGNKLSQCDINKITKWVNEGAPNN